ncbi:citrate:6-N-acetyl-6-N-hydroxy-L-lysine ligase alpha subunit [Vibrio variabilis]|uniref:Citrate:6-N-acetyl-6-N-hydroxy-L-lysine ligase alpha subunit n=1 Tax=Vibrio variabilis TaxID=990271 RepID=A0ABQ0JHZ3_9VIBR|nr:citrate:6-N-acetyl-6-N-hydroxy-L-lysine ligase alpha subunit [Vibrio variabilis]
MASKHRKRDPLLKKNGLHVQQELGGVYCPHPYQSKIEGAYRYSEMLGCIWRERAEAVLSDKQRPLSMATLMQDDGQGNACINELIASSAYLMNSGCELCFGMLSYQFTI